MIKFLVWAILEGCFNINKNSSSWTYITHDDQDQFILYAILQELWILIHFLFILWSDFNWSLQIGVRWALSYYENPRKKRGDYRNRAYQSPNISISIISEIPWLNLLYTKYMPKITWLNLVLNLSFLTLIPLNQH